MLDGFVAACRESMDEDSGAARGRLLLDAATREYRGTFESETLFRGSFQRDGKPAANVRVVLEGVGEVVPGTMWKGRLTLKTDAKGQVRIVSPGEEATGDRYQRGGGGMAINRRRLRDEHGL